MNRKIEQLKKKREIKASEQALTEKQLIAQERLTKAVDGLYELLNGQEQYDFDKLHKQLVEIDKRLDLAPLFTSLEKSIKDASHKPDSKTKIDGFSELLRAVKANKVDVKIDLKKLEKTVVEISQFIQEQSKPSDQGAENYQPMRRVVKLGNRFFFDDNMTSSGGGGGGGGAVQDSLISGDSVKVLEQSGLVPAEYDYISLSYTGDNLTGVVYKSGGSGGTTVATLALAYTGSVLDSVTKT